MASIANSISPIIPENLTVQGPIQILDTSCNASITTDNIEYNRVDGGIKERIIKLKEYRDRYRDLERINRLYENPNNIQHFENPTQDELIETLILGCQPIFLKELKKETIEKYIKDHPAEFL